MSSRSLHNRVSLNGRWTDEVVVPGRPREGGMSWSFGPLSLQEQGDLVSLELAATTVAVMLFDGTLPADRAQSFVLRQGYRVWGSFVLERLEHAGRSETLRLVLRCVARASEAEQPPGPVDLAVLSAHNWGALCVDRASGELMRLSYSGARDLVPGECTRFYVRKSWTKGKTIFVSGETEDPFIDVSALRLPTLQLTQVGMWDPREDAWEEEAGERPAPAWWAAIKLRGARPQFEMEAVLPGADAADPFSDPIVEASECHQAGDAKLAHAMLLKLLEKDLRCLDAHAHLGNFAFDRKPKRAIRHYQVGVALGELALGQGFDGVLPWGIVENRPFLRCLHGYGLCLWRLGRSREAAQVFERMLWLNPNDNQGIRFLADELRRGRAWSPEI